MKCADCTFWAPQTESGVRSVSRVRGRSFGVCERARHFWNATEWIYQDEREDEDDFTRMKDGEDSLMFVQDGSDYLAYLIKENAT